MKDLPYLASIKILDKYFLVLTKSKEGDCWHLLNNSYHLLTDKCGFIVCHFENDEAVIFSNYGLPENLKKQGIGTNSYLALANYYGSLKSGKALSGEALDLWTSLVKNHGAKIISWDIDYSKMTKKLYEDFDEKYFHQDAFYDKNTFSFRFILKG